MPKYNYGTVPAIAWLLGHFFFGCKHYTWVAGEFYPYRQSNPRSSNPYLIYQDIYEPWKEEDDHSKVINQYRINLWGAVEIKRRQGAIDDELADRLKAVCDKINLNFFYPVVCRVDISSLDLSRLKVAGSGTKGSSEYLIEDLQDMEIDNLLFLDFEADKDFNKIVTEEYYKYKQSGNYRTDPNEALEILEGRCDASGIQLPLSNS
ncbi:MAG TPA: hypothetical protein VGN95_25230 [Pyrinomonadaceae bacterium]|nr:hypothetical protein [Pyrinomonadaceae bacterium]